MRHSAIEEEQSAVAYETEPKEKADNKPMPSDGKQFGKHKMPQTSNKPETKHALKMSNRYKEYR